MDVDARHGSILAMAAVGVGVCWCRNQPAAGDTAAASATASEAPAARDVLWGPATPREPTVTSGNTPRKVVQPPGTPSRGTPQDQLWGQSGSEGRPSPRPTRTMLSRRLGSGSAAATAIAGVARASHKLYIGCYSEKQWWVEGQPGEGLYVFDFDAETGGLALDEIERTVVSPSWSAVHPTGKFLFVVTEKGPDDKETDSFVTCYSIGETGTLTYISKQLTGGLGGNCITVVGDSAVVCTNYFTGSLASFPFNPQTGVLGSATVTPHVQAATGPIADRQEGAHPHDLYVKGSQLFVPDLGMDQVLGYAVDSATAKLTPLPSGAPSYQSSPGSGCRGIQPHPMLSDTIYLISELDGSLAVLRLPADGSGKLTEIQSGVKTYPPSAPGGPEGKWPDRWASGLAVSVDGKFLYAANRKDDSFAIFSCAPADGTLTLITHYSHKGQNVHTRNMQIIEGRERGDGGPASRHLVVAHQDSDTLAVYVLDTDSGLIVGDGPVSTAVVPSAGNVCVYSLDV